MNGYLPRTRTKVLTACALSLLSMGCASTAGAGSFQTSSIVTSDFEVSSMSEDVSKAYTTLASTGASEQQDGGHGGHGDHPNHVALFLGDTTIQGEHGFTFGVDYERRLNETWGVGVLFDRAEGDFEATIYAATLYAHPAENWTILLAPGFERSHGEEEFLTRIGGSYGVPMNGFTLGFGAYLDLISGGHEALVFGISIGKGF